MRWQDAPWFESRRSIGLVRLLERLSACALEVDTVEAFLQQALQEALGEFNGSAAAIIRRTPDWTVVQHRGRVDLQPNDIDGGLLIDVLDREAAVCASGGLEPILAAPIPDGRGSILLLSGERLGCDDLPGVLAMGRALGMGLRCVTRHSGSVRRVERLRHTLEVAQTFAKERETLPLLELMAHEATEMLDCDRASIFIWDRDQRQVIACPALGVEGGRLFLPDNKGIVGEVIQTGRAVRVNDAYADPRFDQSVDRQSGYTTRNLLCVPMTDPEGRVVGAFELINKERGPFTDDDLEALRELCIPAAVAVLNARERDQLVRSNQQLTERVAGQIAIIGESPSMAALRGTIERLAATDLPVLILGESGTGKEVAAQALHYRGPRANHPFIAVNCAALTETLLESELFGHEKGAFTDAHSMHRGKFELAEGGTLFLDEIGDMSPGGQAKLLRVLEQKVITRVGGSQPIPINVRVVAATNSNLAESVRVRKFRQDLYYRLSVVTVDLPPLRERPEDVLPLAKHFLDMFCRQASRRPMELSQDARRRLQAHAWPGNVRELRNLMERVAFLSHGPQVEVEDLAFILAPQREEFDELAEGVGLAEATNHFQQEYIRKAIKRVQGNMSEAARLLGLHRSNLYRKMRQLDMDVDESKP
jgi:Nif-specific regulatory protein